MAERPAAEHRVVTMSETLEDTQRRAVAAFRRSMNLLRANLTPAQLSQLDTTGYITVMGCDTGWIYYIHGEVRDLRVEVPEIGYKLYLCYSVPHVPQPDNALAMKWAFEFDELRHLKRIGQAQLPRLCWERVLKLDRLRRELPMQEAMWAGMAW